MNKNVNKEIVLRLALILGNAGDLMGRAEKCAHAGGLGFMEASQRLPFLLGELSNEVDDARRLRAYLDLYLLNPGTYESEALEFIATNARSATLPGESWVDVEAWAAAQLGEVAA
jgi:hypothetical protein